MKLAKVAGMLVLALAACGGTTAVQPGSSSPASSSVLASAPASPARQGLAKLTMSYSQIAGDQMVTWVGKESGIYERNGLDVDLRQIASTTGISALLAGDVNVSSIGGSEAMAAAVGGADLIIAATLAPVYTFKLEAAPDIKTKEDLIGKKLGVTRPGSTTDTAARDTLRKIGLQPDKDVAVVPTGSDKTASIAALLNGTVQGILQQPPDDLEVESRGFHALFDLASLGLPAAAAVITTQRPWAANHREVMQKFIDSLVQATAREKKDRALGEAVVRKYYKTDDQRLITYAYEYHSNTHPAYPYPSLDHFSSIISNIKAQNPNAKDFDFGKVIDSSWMKSAEERKVADAV